MLAAVGRRRTNAEISHEFHISVLTVESHIASLRRKLDVETRAGLIEAAGNHRSAVEAEAMGHHCGAAEDGKTRLALELAVDGRVPVVADLEHVDPSEVVSVVAKSVGLVTDTADLVAACGVTLASAKYPLVLDNCERVADAVGALTDALLSLADSLTVLARSRSPVSDSSETSTTTSRARWSAPQAPR